MAAAKKKKKKVSIKKPPVLFAQTQELIRAIEKKLKRPLIAYWTSPNGSVCSNDVIAMYEVLSEKLGHQDEIAMCIKSGGGSGEASLRIINLLRQYAKRVTALVPLECASAATMMALGADEIQMGPLSYLTAVDTSLRHELSPADIDNELVSVSQDELLRVVRLWNKTARPEDGNAYGALYPHVHPLVIGAVDRVSSLSMKLCQDILGYHMKDASRAEKISRHLNEAYPSHEYPITLHEAKGIGLRVRPLRKDVNDLLLELNELYAEMGQRALTDYDEQSYHSHEIVNIVEGSGIQVYYQTDKDWYYRKEERRWAPLNDQSSWRRMEASGKKIKSSVLHIR